MYVNIKYSTHGIFYYGLTPHQIGDVVAFLASDKASFMTGCDINVDGVKFFGSYHRLTPPGDFGERRVEHVTLIRVRVSQSRRSLILSHQLRLFTIASLVISSFLYIYFLVYL